MRLILYFSMTVHIYTSLFNWKSFPKSMTCLWFLTATILFHVLSFVIDAIQKCPCNLCNDFETSYCSATHSLQGNW